MLSVEWIAGPALALAGWGSRLQLQVNKQDGRINQLETIDIEREKLATYRHIELVRRLDRIESKQDNGKNRASS